MCARPLLTTDHRGRWWAIKWWFVFLSVSCQDDGDPIFSSDGISSSSFTYSDYCAAVPVADELPIGRGRREKG